MQNNFLLLNIFNVYSLKLYVLIHFCKNSLSDTLDWLIQCKYGKRVSVSMHKSIIIMKLAINPRGHDNSIDTAARSTKPKIRVSVPLTKSPWLFIHGYI
jgi:hypothetical protein